MLKYCELPGDSGFGFRTSELLRRMFERTDVRCYFPKLPRLLPLPFRRGEGWGEGLLRVVYPAVLAVYQMLASPEIVPRCLGLGRRGTRLSPFPAQGTHSPSPYPLPGLIFPYLRVVFCGS